MKKALKKLISEPTGVTGDLTGVTGDIDKCELTKTDRENGVLIEEMI